MDEKFNIFTEVSPEHIFAYIDCLANKHEGVAAGAFCDPFTGKVDFLKNEIHICQARIEQLEAERAQNSRKAQLAAAFSREMRQNLEREKAAIPDWPEYDAAKDLYGQFCWLANKFRLSRSFSLFGERALSDLPANSKDLKEEIRLRYFSLLGLDSMEPIMDVIKAYEATLLRLDADERTIFPGSSGFTAYFEKVGKCLDATGELPKAVLQKQLEETKKESANALLVKGISTLFEYVVPKNLDDGSWNFLDLLNDCNSIGDDLAKEIIKSNERLKNAFALAMAIFPDAEYRDMAEYYRPKGQGDPDNKRGALNRFIQNTKI